MIRNIVFEGVLAMIIHHRFDKKTREQLLKIEWWNRDLSWIADNAKYFEDVDLLLKIEV